AANRLRNSWRPADLDKSRLLPEKHFNKGRLTLNVIGHGVDDVTFVNMQLTVAIGARVALNHRAASGETSERYYINQPEILQCSARSSCLHPGSEQRLHGCAEIDELKRLLKKLQCAVRAAFAGHFRRCPRSNH